MEKLKNEAAAAWGVVLALIALASNYLLDLSRDAMSWGWAAIAVVSAFVVRQVVYAKKTFDDAVDADTFIARVEAELRERQGGENAASTGTAEAQVEGSPNVTYYEPPPEQ